MTNDDLERLLSDAAIPPAEQHFSSGFADRVMRRVAERDATRRDPAGALSHAMARQARRLLPALVAASLAITAWSWWSVRETGEASLAAAFGLEPVTLATALGTGSLIGAEELQ
jgi:peptidoglycan/LPS O-acetylase OafA/YrhL